MSKYDGRRNPSKKAVALQYEAGNSALQMSGYTWYPSAAVCSAHIKCLTGALVRHL